MQRYTISIRRVMRKGDRLVEAPPHLSLGPDVWTVHGFFVPCEEQALLSCVGAGRGVETSSCTSGFWIYGALPCLEKVRQRLIDAREQSQDAVLPG